MLINTIIVSSITPFNGVNIERIKNSVKPLTLKIVLLVNNTIFERSFFWQLHGVTVYTNGGVTIYTISFVCENYIKAQ